MNGNLEIKFEYHYVAMAVAVEIGFFLSQMTLQHGDLITTYLHTSKFHFIHCKFLLKGNKTLWRVLLVIKFYQLEKFA